MAPKAKPRKQVEASPGYLARFLNWFKGRDPKKPVNGIVPRLRNIAKFHFRGLLGVIVPLAALSWQWRKKQPHLTIKLVWLWMIWFYIWQPVAVPITGLIPLYAFAMGGVMSTNGLAKSYFTEGVILFLTGGMLILALNNSGVDRRIAVWLVCSGDACQFSPKRLIFKFSTAAFFLSLFSSRLIVSSFLMQYSNKIFEYMISYGGKKPTEPNYVEMRWIINNAIQTASTIGSIGLIHANFGILTMRALYYCMPGYQHDNIMNYLQYTAFAFPVSFIMFIVNFCYHILLIMRVINKPMSAAAKIECQKITQTLRNSVPKNMSCHEQQSVLFLIASLIIFFFRRSVWMNGWAEYMKSSTSNPPILDSCVAAMFVIALHIFPNKYRFLSYANAEKKSQLPPLKPEAGLLWWRFVDKNVNYGYFMVIGGGIILLVNIIKTEYDKVIAEPGSPKQMLYYPYNASLFFVCALSAIFSNCCTSVATITMFLPYVVTMAAQGSWTGRMHIACLAIGIGANFGFCAPFLYTPAYFCHHTGKTPIRKMIKYSFLATVICIIILWLALMMWAPMIWENQVYVQPAAPQTTSPTSPNLGRR